MGFNSGFKGLKSISEKCDFLCLYQYKITCASISYKHSSLFTSTHHYFALLQLQSFNSGLRFLPTGITLQLLCYRHEIPLRSNLIYRVGSILQFWGENFKVRRRNHDSLPARLMDITMTNNAIPADWRKAMVVPIYKGEIDR